MKKMSEKEKESIADKKISRRSMLKWTAGLAVAGAVGVGVGYGASQLLTPTKPPEVVTQVQTQTAKDYFEDQVFITCASGHSTSRGTVIKVHVRAGKIAWVEPFDLTDQEAQSNVWTFKAGGRTFRPEKRAQTGPQEISLKSRAYDPSLLMYPMKRVGWAPGGMSNTSNRGKGEFVRITWNEAFDTVANEIKRINEKYGPSGKMAFNCTHWCGGYLHHNTGFSRYVRFLPGGITERQGLSGTWQHWQYGGTFIWGMKWSNGEAGMDDVFADMMQNSKLGIWWGTAATGNEDCYGAHTSAIWRFWMKELGIKLITINPLLEDTGAVYADQWIGIIPGTDVAMALAIANVWIKEGTYDKDYVATHTVGFDKFSDYVLGKKDGPDGTIDRTPDWASKITGVPADTITTLAREWGSKPASLMCYDSGINRSYFGHEWCRMMVALQAMQGVGKPGVNFWHGSIKSTAEPIVTNAPGFVSLGAVGPGTSGSLDTVAKNKQPRNPVKQKIDAQIFPEAFLTDFTKNPSLKFRGGISCGSWNSADDPFYKDPFTELEYPMPGYSEVRMLIRAGGGGGTGMCQNDCSAYARALQSPKLETIVIQAPNNEPEVWYSDIVLPACLSAERTDIGESTTPSYNITLWHKLIEPLGERKTDLDICTGIMERLGLKDKFTDGNSEEDWLRKLYEFSDASKDLPWEQFKEKGYYVPPFPANYDYTSQLQLRWFYDKPGDQITGPENGLDTPSGKIEFQSKLLTDFFGEHSTVVGDVPKYLVSPFGRYSPFAKKYPLQINAEHSKYRDHTKFNSAPFLQDVYKYKGYEPAEMNPADANARGIKEKDIVRIYNDTSSVLAYAHLTERVIPGVVHLAWGSWYRPLEPGNPNSPDKGGEYNTLVSRVPAKIDENGRIMNEYIDANGNIAYQQPLCLATHGHSVLAEIEKWTGAT
jgi:molybdopterin guanine dinucleotide-containing S/N-oxide reductase-like protein